MKEFLFFNYYDNTIDPFIPELWANESLAILEENMVAANLIHRDFEPILAQYGDVVNTRRPGEFKSKRKTNSDNVTVQDGTATNVQVPLNQHVHVSFLIKDGEESKSFKDLIETYLSPAMLAQARFIDQVVLGQYSRFLMNTGGTLGGLTTANGKGYILDTRKVMNVNKAYLNPRNLILNPYTETDLLNLDIFIQAQQVGDAGTALREASLGRKLGFDMYMCQNMPVVTAGNTNIAGAVNLSAGYKAGYAGALVVNGFVGIVGTNSWVAVDGTPYRVKAHTETSSNTTGITLDRPLRSDVANAAVITAYTAGAVNFSAGYALGYGKEITVNTFTVAPQIGQSVSFGSYTTEPYTIIDVNGLVGITLDRPLDAAIANTDPVYIGPPGQYNFAFHRNALTLVVRPLAMPMPGTGARSAVVNMNGLSMRAVITYDGNAQGHLVTLDMLCGVQVLDTKLGAVMLG